MSKACAYGDFDRLKGFVAEDPSCVNAADESGYLPLQWAALNNRINETNYLLSQGALINAVDGTGQTALHWAAVRGSLPVIEALLRNNADYEVKDNRGYIVTHVAAQYGQTAVLYLMVRVLLACMPVSMPCADPTSHAAPAACNCAHPACRQRRPSNGASTLTRRTTTGARRCIGRPTRAFPTRSGCCWCWTLATPSQTRRGAPRCTGQPSRATARRAPCCCRCARAVLRAGGEGRGSGVASIAARRDIQASCLTFALAPTSPLVFSKQGGSLNVLTQKDVTGLTPPQLALEKGHRYLGLHLADYKRKQEGDGL